MLQCVAVCCSVLQCVAVCCSATKGILLVTASFSGLQQCVAVCCTALQCVAVCCSVLHCVAVFCSALQCVAMWCSTLQQCVAVLRGLPELRIIFWIFEKEPLKYVYAIIHLETERVTSKGYSNRIYIYMYVNIHVCEYICM